MADTTVTSRRVATHRFYYHKGDTWDGERVVWKDSAGAAVDLTGYAVKMQLRSAADATVIAELTGGDGLTVTPLDGKIEINASPAKMIDTVEGAVYKYDLQVSIGGNVRTLLRGEVWIDEEITE